MRILEYNIGNLDNTILPGASEKLESSLDILESVLEDDDWVNQV